MSLQSSIQTWCDYTRLKHKPSLTINSLSSAIGTSWHRVLTKGTAVLSAASVWVEVHVSQLEDGPGPDCDNSLEKTTRAPHLHSVQTTQGSKAPLVWMMSTKAADSLVMMFSASSGMAST